MIQFGVLRDVTVIEDPSLSSCGRFEVSPSASYGLNAEKTLALRVMNQNAIFMAMRLAPVHPEYSYTALLEQGASTMEVDCNLICQ